MPLLNKCVLPMFLSYAYLPDMLQCHCSSPHFASIDITSTALRTIAYMVQTRF